MGAELAYRIAVLEDIAGLSRVRGAVKENILVNFDKVTPAHYEDHIVGRGKTWVCEERSDMVGFMSINLDLNSVWALFVLPDHERLGIGSQLQCHALHWYFNQTDRPIHLLTDEGTRAEGFYSHTGWVRRDYPVPGEAKFEMTFPRWRDKFAN